MSLATVRKLLEQHLDGIAPAIATLWENGDTLTNVDPTKPYQQVWLMTANPSNPEISGGFYIEQGYLQVNLRFPAGKGPKDIDARVELIRTAFPFGLSMSANGITVIINRTPSRSPGAQDGDRYQVPVKIFFTANSS